MSSSKEKKSAKDLKRTKSKISYLEFKSTKGGKAFLITFFTIIGIIIAFAITIPYFLSGDNKKVIGYTRDSASGTFEAFEKIALETDAKDKQGAKFVANKLDNEDVVFTNHVQEVASNDQMIQAVSNNYYGVGYVSTFTLENNTSVIPVSYKSCQGIGDVGSCTAPLDKEISRSFNILWEDPGYGYEEWLVDTPQSFEEWNKFIAYSFYYWVIDSPFATEIMRTASYPAQGEFSLVDGKIDSSEVIKQDDDKSISRISGTPSSQVDKEITDNLIRASGGNDDYKTRELRVITAGSTSVKQVVAVLENTFMQLFGFQKLTFDTSQMQGSGYALTTQDAHIGFQSKNASASEIVASTGMPISEYVIADAYIPFAIDSVSIIINEEFASDHNCLESNCYITQEGLLNVYYGDSLDIDNLVHNGGGVS